MNQNVIKVKLCELYGLTEVRLNQNHGKTSPTVTPFLIRSVITSEYVDKPVIYSPFSIDALPGNLTPGSNRIWQVLYAPESDYLDGIMSGVAKDLKVITKGFANESSLLDYFSETASVVLSGVIFKEDIKDGITSSTNISFTIRPKTAEVLKLSGQNATSTWFTQQSFPLFPALGPRNKELGWGGNPGYMSQGFLSVQHAISKNFMKNLNKTQDLQLDLKMCRYPYPPYLDDKFILALQLFFPMIICFSFIYPAVNIVKNIVVEKEKKLKEAMKMMGLSKWLHWTAWYIKYILFLFLSCCIITALLCIKFSKGIAVVNQSDPTVFLLWLIIYSSSTICFCFFISTIFSKANSSAAGSGVIFFLTFVPYFFILPRYADMTLVSKAVACLLPNLAIAMGSVVLTVSESTGTGMQWSNIGIPPTPDDKLSLSLVLIMLIISGVVSLFLTWYIENVLPGEYGVPEVWYFPFTRTYWCGQETNFSEMVQFFNSEGERSEYFEQDPVGLMAGIQMQGLTKVFKKSNAPAVNNMNLNMYRSNITVLLGHNGAGKSTTISMLTGLIPPTSGTANVNGYDIREEIGNVHSNLGICPQHDVLFDELTVEEHLYFFCKLKGYIADMVPSEIDRILSCLKLDDKRYSQAHSLSGGWRRRLSVGIALVGGSQIVILDEPTSGMDPFNRRSLWDVLQAEKEYRTILLTTHFMEEADVLGDRIAIMANGEVQCCGSPLFLKKKYGAGYHLVMVKEAACDVSIVTKLVQSHVPNAEMSSNIGTELKYVLPHENSDLFHALFSELESRKKELNISGYGASITTMEEVFIKVGRQHHKNDIAETLLSKDPLPPKESSADSGVHINAPDNDDSSTDVDIQSVEDQMEEKNTGIKLFFQHLHALLEKRVLHSLRNWTLTISQLLLPPFFLILTLVMIKTLPKYSLAPSLPLNIASYRGTEIPFLVNTEFNETRTLGNIFRSQFSGVDVPVFLNSSSTNITSYLVNEAEKDLGKFNLHNMVAGTFDKNASSNELKITSLFNDQAYHSPAIALLEMDKALLKYWTNDSFTFAVTNHPLPKTLSEKGKQQQTDQTISYQIAQDIMFGMSFLIASFAVFIIKERSSNSKHLQRVSGVNLFSYWLASFMWDFLNYLIPCCLVLLVFQGFGTEGLSSGEEQGRLFLLFFIHGFSALPFVYCCTFLFLSPSTAYVRLSLFNILFGIASLLTITILEIPYLGTEYVAKPLDVLFSLLIPNFSLGRAVSNLYQNHQFNGLCNHKEVKWACELEVPPIFDLVKPCCKGKCDDECFPWEEHYLSWTSPGIGKQLVFFVIQSVIYTCLLIMCEKNLFRYILYKIRGQKVNPSDTLPFTTSHQTEIIEDEDVRLERVKMQNIELPRLFQSNHLVIKDVSKKYGSFLAVDRLSFGVRRGECFGLLGLNGAGKTTTFKMITGDESISSGDIYVNGFNVKKEMRKVQSRIGYCPQFDALIDQLTGRETLTLFARLRGIPEYLIAEQVSSLSELLTFNMHIDKQVKDYSGGNKRKISTAIALVGNPPVIFLDEPTTGMDPVSRRCMWTVLLQVMQSGRSVVLTSHSMEECEALCNRLVIMVNGRLCCLGSPQHLKTKFGQGFTLMIKVGRKSLARSNRMRSTYHSLEDSQVHTPSQDSPVETNMAQDMDEIRSFVERTFASATLKNEHENLLHYHIPSPQLNWAEIFRAMEEAKLSLNIEDYSVGETTLEQVFLNFAMVQRES
ncbi:hypothetical protein JTE90_018283 [Oedothorax gibbosus]|uniref:ABC transporter domain-containing protein n=1 Tax=Oedothorax gibbosus TaxID=931172 RepID=A0AAV6UYZ9_9ARAC|nr:hypothetical protein JTE90_018283 [Oedothorax gibbosus]